jgi:hypothetical protein
MTNLHVHSNSSDPTPVADVKGRLAEILEAAQQLHTDAEWLSITAAGLLTDLEKIVGDRVTHGNTALAAAIDCAKWVDSAALNVQDELGTLIDHLYAAGEEPIAPQRIVAE